MYIGETQCRMPSKFSDAALITYRQHTSFYRTSYVPDMNYILYSPTFFCLPLLTDPMDSLSLTLLRGWWGYILIYLCMRQRAS